MSGQGGLSRKLAFARHVPPRQLLRRLQLSAKRRLLDKQGTPPPPPAPMAPEQHLTSPALYAPHGQLIRDNDGWSATFLGETRHFGDHIDWVLEGTDPRTQLWRMNLHYFEYLPDLDGTMAKEVIADWIERVRPRTASASGAAWTPYAISLRLSAWLGWWSRGGGGDDPAFLSRFGGSVREQADYLAANLETDVRGNHLIKNIRALTECGAVWPGAEGAKWRRVADRWLYKEFRAQILPDGMHFERSPSYHAQVFADLLTIAFIRPPDDLSPLLEDALTRMAQALADLTHTDGKPVQFGDAGLDMCMPAATALAAWTAHSKSPAPEPHRHFAFAEAGFYGFRSETDYLAVRMGPLGPDPLMAHAHGDWGSFEWSHLGQRLIVDQGVYEYIEGEKRRQSRDAYYHNTAVLDGAAQADFFGAFRCGARPHPPRPLYEEKADGFSLRGELSPACHPQKGRQERMVSFTDGRLLIEDRARHSSSATLDTSLLLHPEIEVHSTDDGMTLRMGNGVGFRVNSPGAALAIEPAVWWPNMGSSLSTARLRLRGQGKVMTQITMEPAR